MSETYRPFTAEDAIAYARTRAPLAAVADSGAPFQAREVGDGNLNVVYIVSSAAGPSAVLKQALPYMRLIGEAWPLTIDRNRLEREAYAVFGSMVPELVPVIYGSDPAHALFLMEDLSRLQIVRRATMERRALPRLAPDIARFMAQTLLRTSDFYLPSAEKKRLVAQFSNPELCKITEDFIFTNPFHDEPSNGYDAALQPEVEALWGDERALRHEAALRLAFLSRAEALVHGDMHTGSIMASAEETKVLDPEFCFVGPMAFDPGIFIANLLLSALSHLAAGPEGAGAAYAEWLFAQVAVAWGTFERLASVLLERAPVWCPAAGARAEFLGLLLRDAVGYAGTEMIRRTIGLAKVADLEAIEDHDARVRTKTAVLRLARLLLREHRGYDRIEQVVAAARSAATGQFP